MVSYLLASIVALLVLAGIAALIISVISRPRGAQLGSGETPQLPDPSPRPAAQTGSHRVVAIHAGASLAAQLREHANAAELAGLRPFLEFGAIWCPPSKMFGDILDDPRMAAALSGIYLIRAELDDFAGDPRARELGVVSVPVFFELDAEGNATGRKIDGGAWGPDTIDNMSRTMGPFFAGA